MSDGAVPVHLAGVATGQSRGSYLFGTLMVLILMLIGAIIVYIPVMAAARRWPDLSYLSSYGLLAINALAIPVLALIVHRLHRMRLRDLIAPGRPVDWGMAVRSALVYAVPLLAQVVIALWRGELRQADTALPVFLLLAPVSVALFALQASAEELLFRGYLAQGAQLLFRRALPAALLTALLFTLAHEGGDARAVWAQRVQIMMVALFLSWLTLRFGRLEAAMGVHVINNVIFSFFIGGSTLPFPDLLTLVDPDPPDIDGLIELAELILHFLVPVGFYWLVGIKTGFVERGLSPRQA